MMGLVLSTLSVLLNFSKKLSRSKKWVSAHKRAMHKLYSLAIKLVDFTRYFCGNIKINIILDDMRILEHFERQPFSVFVVNHPNYIDPLYALSLYHRLGFPSAYRYLTAHIKYIFPTFGVSNELFGNLFVGRSWKQDKLELSKQLNNLLSSEKQLAVIYWPEGYVFSSDRHKRATEYSESKEIKPFKYHLVPKTKGFNLILKKLVRSSKGFGKKVHIYNTQIVYRENTSIMDWFNGKEIYLDSFIEEIELNKEVLREALDESLQPEDCKACSKFMYDVFERKDELIEEYKRNGNKFVSAPSGGVLEEAPLLDMFLVWLASATLTLWLMFYIFGGLAGLVTALAVVAAGVTLALTNFSRFDNPILFHRSIETVSKTKSLEEVAAC